MDRSNRWIVCWGTANQNPGTVQTIGIDEIQDRRGHWNLTLVYQTHAGCRRLLYVARDRMEYSLRGFFNYPENNRTGAEEITDQTNEGDGSDSARPPGAVIELVLSSR